MYSGFEKEIKMKKEDIVLMYVSSEILSEEDKKKAKDNDLDTSQVILFPRSQKKRFTACNIVLQQFVEGSNMGKELAIGEELTYEFKRLLASVNYLINSTSFQTGKYEDFDRMEIDRKLGRLI